MMKLGLTRDQQRAFEAGLCTDHEIRVRLDVLDLTHKLVATSSDRVLSGQVDVDTTAEVTRSAQVSVLDPGNTLGIDTGSPHSAGMWADRMIRITQLVRSQQHHEWVAVPLFTGPITSASRHEGVLTISAHGKESLMMGAVGYHWRVRKGKRKTAFIRELAAGCGETFMEIPDLGDKMTLDAVVASVEQPWVRMQGMARALGMKLWYDGRGTLRLTRPGGVCWTFRGGDGGTLLGEPQLTTDISTIKNLVVVVGGVPAGAKKRVVAQAVAQASHPFAPARLGRNGRPRYLREDVADDGITSQQAAQNLANDKLWELLQAGIDVQWECLPVPHLEPWDKVRVQAETWSWETQVDKFTIPLAADGVMSIGKHQVTRAVRGFKPTRAKRLAVPPPKKAVKPTTAAKKGKR